MRGSNRLIGAINFTTLMASIPVLAGGIWLSTRANTTHCLRLLQWPLIAIAVALTAVSFIGFTGACRRSARLLCVYLSALFLAAAALVSFVAFSFAATAGAGRTGRPVPGRAYLEYRFVHHSGWLADRVSDSRYWDKIRFCLRDAGACRKMGRYVNGALPEPADVFFRRKLSPLESGCCKPPTWCGFAYVNETVWTNNNPGGGGDSVNAAVDDPDCTRWSNEQEQLCYGCDSCKAAVLVSLGKSWRKVSAVNAVVLFVLAVVFAIGVCAALSNNRSKKYSTSHTTTTREELPDDTTE